MLTKKVLVSALIAVGMIGAVATPLSSFAQIEFQLNFGPPTPRHEPVPAPRSGHVWSGGNWQWDGSQYVWVAGNWQTARPGYLYSQPQWVERGGRWNYQSSRWDRDGDGIPDRKDARPDDPTRR